MTKSSDLVQGTLDLLLLKILAPEPLNGYAISQRLEQVSGDVSRSANFIIPALPADNLRLDRPLVLSGLARFASISAKTTRPRQRGFHRTAGRAASIPFA